MSTLRPEPPVYSDATAPVPPDNATPKPQRILIAGAGGMIGSVVAPCLAQQGHTVVRLVRRTPGMNEVYWDPDAGTIEAAGLEGFDGVVHVASLPQARWTSAFIKRWRENHIGTNRLLAETLAHCQEKPRVLVCASAQGIYPPSGGQVLAEDSAVGTDYLAELLRDGEQATTPASEAGIRAVHLRIPTVLSGASLAAMNSNIRRLGSGQQWFSWVARDEMAGIVQHALVTDTLEGPVNACSPNPVRNAEFFATLARVRGRTPRLPMPAFVLRLMLGGMADALILASRRLVPQRLLETGYVFRFAEIEAALRHELAPGT
jgi:uncharacterized protein